jgi:hypothetical protein
LSLETTDRRYLIDTTVRSGLAVALYVAFPAFSDILRLWERRAGLVPGWPENVFEYPPIAAIYFEPFTYLPSGRWAVVVNGAIMVAAAVGVTWLLIRASSRLTGHGGADVGMWVASPALLLLLPVNWDVLVVFISVLGVYSLYRSREAVSGVLHGIGTAFKVFPGAVVFTVLPLIDGWRRRVIFLASGFLALAVPYAIYIAVDPEGWRFHLDFASSRTDIDSTIWGVIDVVAGWFGGAIPIGVVTTASTVLLAISLLAVTFWVARARPTFAQAAAMALLVLLIFNKVFKPQYVLWVLPFLAWARVGRFKVRLVEITALVQFVVIYFSLPEFIYPIEASVRTVALALIAVELFGVSSAESRALSGT